MKRKKIIIISVTILIILFIGNFLINILPFLYKAPLKKFTIVYPYDESIFPADIAPPTFWWEDKTGANTWIIQIEFQNNSNPLKFKTSSKKWTPERNIWEIIKKQSIEKTAKVTVTGVRKLYGIEIKGLEKTISIKTSKDEVGSPIFFRSVPLPFEHAINYMDSIKLCLGDVSSEKPPKVVLENLPV